MPVDAQWDNAEQTVILMTLSGTWQWEGILAAKDRINAMLDSVGYPVNIIVHDTNERWMPGNYRENLRLIFTSVHPNTGLVVIVYTTPLFRELFEAFNRMSGRVSFKYRFARSLAEARALLRLL